MKEGKNTVHVLMILKIYTKTVETSLRACTHACTIVALLVSVEGPVVCNVPWDTFFFIYSTKAFRLS